ncbi:aspartate aminotransferase family protein [Candidatus Poribacteria bacterium]|nr:aspartate aminotransferase family protein [Candidatus Poribacteria bacterium]
MASAAGVIAQTENAFFPVFTRHDVVVDRADGWRVWDTDGREYLDLTSGWGVTCLGHCHPALVDGISRQLRRCLQAPNCNLSYTPIQAEAVDRLVKAAPTGLTRAFLTNSGAEATEGAIKLVRRATGKTGIIATHGGFHGRTLGAASITSGEGYRVPFGPLVPGASFVAFGDAGAAEAAIGDDTGGLIVEPVQGEGGVNVPPDGYLRALREIADRRGVLLILDEIQTGIGRTGTMFACEREAVTPDIMLLGKCLGGGFPVGAILVTDGVSSTIQKGDHGGTYAGSPLASAAVVAVLSELEDGAVLANCLAMGELASDRLVALRRDAPAKIVDIRGAGLLLGCELVSPELASDVAARCLEAGVLVNVAQQRILRLFPCLNIDPRALTRGLDVIGEAVRAA